MLECPYGLLAVKLLTHTHTVALVAPSALPGEPTAPGTAVRCCPLWPSAKRNVCVSPRPHKPT